MHAMTFSSRTCCGFEKTTQKEEIEEEAKDAFLLAEAAAEAACRS
jgi:hypothetical protein